MEEFRMIDGVKKAPVTMKETPNVSGKQSMQAALQPAQLVVLALHCHDWPRTAILTPPCVCVLDLMQLWDVSLVASTLT